MPDPYVPALSTFVFTQAQDAAVQAALLLANPWDGTAALGANHGIIAALKNQMRDFHLQRHNATCCYCRENLFGGGPFTTDREHILPKGNILFRPYTYSIANLGLACKRCNLDKKKQRYDFVVDTAIAGTPNDNSANYLLVHPNFDRWEDHLFKWSAQLNQANIVFFSVRNHSLKGTYTFDFFSLNEKIRNSFDIAQGLKNTASKIADKVRALARQFNQG